MTKKEMSERKIINQISTVGVFGNIALTVFKLLAGIFAHSNAMISDAIHSLSDVFATAIAYIGVRMSKKDADKDHPYGHDRLESIASIMLSLILIATGLGIGFKGLESILANLDGVKTVVPGKMALVAAVISILAKEAMFWYTRHYAKVLNSQAFMADAWHHRSDAISSVGSLIGIAFSRMGFPIFDPIASVLIALLILKVGFEIFKGGFEKMVDKSCSEEVEEEIEKIALSHEGVVKVDLIKTREFGAKMYVDLELQIDGNLPLKEAHAISQKVHDHVERKFPDCKHCMIHLNPAK